MGRKRRRLAKDLVKLHVGAEHEGVPALGPGQVILVLLHHVRADDRAIVGISDRREVVEGENGEPFKARRYSAEVRDTKTLLETRSSGTTRAVRDVIVPLEAKMRFIQQVPAKGVRPS